MGISKVFRSIATVVGFATVTATATLALVLPRTTLADDVDDAMGTVAATRFEHVLVKTRVQRDATSSSGWSLLIDAQNEGDVAQSCEFKTALERTFSTPMARTQSEVTTLLTRVETLSVPAHGKVHLVRPVPKWIADQLVTAERMQKARDAETKRAENDPTAYYSAIMRAPYPDFRVAVVEPNAPIARVRFEGGMMEVMPPRPVATPPAPSAAPRPGEIARLDTKP